MSAEVRHDDIYYKMGSQALEGLPVEVKKEILEAGTVASGGEQWFEHLRADVLVEEIQEKNSSQG